MPIASTDIRFFYPAVTTEGPTHGGTSTTNAIGTTKNALWDDVLGSEANSGKTEYRKIFVGLDKTGAGGSTLSNTVIWIATATPADDEILLQSETIAGNASNVMTAVTTLNFSTSHDCKSNGVTLGDITTATAVGIWLRRAVTSSTAAYANNTAVLTVEGDTA